jgi:flagellin-like protein
MKRKGKKAVSPVLATLLMIAIAVSMSVILFMWSQNFLATTGEATAGQQAVQIRAAQSSIALESVSFRSATRMEIVARNTGSANINIGGVYINGLPINTTYSTSTGLAFPSGTAAVWYAFEEDNTQTTTAINLETGTVPMRGYALIKVNFGSPFFTLGSTYTIKVTTTVGTFAETTLMPTAWAG